MPFWEDHGGVVVGSTCSQNEAMSTSIVQKPASDDKSYEVFPFISSTLSSYAEEKYMQ